MSQLGYKFGAPEKLNYVASWSLSPKRASKPQVKAANHEVGLGGAARMLWPPSSSKRYTPL